MLGDTTDIAGRLRAVLPKRWFSEQAPILATVLNCFAVPWAWLYGLLGYVKVQGRISTATGDWLDLIAKDFFGSLLERKVSESDQAYRSRIKSSLLSSAATRDAIASSLTNLTGTPCTVFEPARCLDTGAYGAPQIGQSTPAFGLAYGSAGGWGNLNLPYQAFITVRLSPISATCPIAGYGSGGYGVGTTYYLSLSTLSGQVTEQDIQSTVARLLPVNAIAWLRVV